MFEASGEKLSLAAVITRTQFVSQATSSITKESMENLRARENGPAYHIGHAQLSLSFGLANVIASVGGRNSSIETLNSSTNRIHTLASKVLHTLLFISMEWLSPKFQHANVFHLACRILEEKASLFYLTIA